jgi:hypothetical protein
MKQLRLQGHGNIREQAMNIREHRFVISYLQAVMSTTLCGSLEVLKRPITESASAHFRYLVNHMARICACKPPESVSERFNIKYDGLLTKAEVADATARDVRAVTEANCALLNSRQPTLEALLALCEDALTREICLTLGASEDIPPSMDLAEYPVADIHATAVKLGSPPPSIEARVLATELRTLATSPPSSVDAEAYVKYMGNVDSALSRFAVLNWAHSSMVASI